MKKVNVPGNTVASVALWDLPSREDMDMRETYYRNVDAAIGKLTPPYVWFREKYQ